MRCLRRSRLKRVAGLKFLGGRVCMVGRACFADAVPSFRLHDFRSVTEEKYGLSSACAARVAVVASPIDAIGLRAIPHFLLKGRRG